MSESVMHMRDGVVNKKGTFSEIENESDEANDDLDID